MLYAEAAYFDGHHCAHVAAWEEHRRLQRLAREAVAAHHCAHVAAWEEHRRLQRLAREAVAAHRRRFPRVAAMWGRARG